MLRRIGGAIIGAAFLMAMAAGSVAAGPPRVEVAWFEGTTVHFLQPAVYSSDPNQGIFACFNTGPDLSESNRSAPAPNLYVILNDYATQDHCDGAPTQLRHDHVLSTAPGHPGYDASWTLVLTVPGPAFDPAKMPYTSVSQVMAGVAANELVLVPTGVRIIGPVVGR